MVRPPLVKINCVTLVFRLNLCKWYQVNNLHERNIVQYKVNLYCRTVGLMFGENKYKFSLFHILTT